MGSETYNTVFVPPQKKWNEKKRWMRFAYPPYQTAILRAVAESSNSLENLFCLLF